MKFFKDPPELVRISLRGGAEAVVEQRGDPPFINLYNGADVVSITLDDMRVALRFAERRLGKPSSIKRVPRAALAIVLDLAKSGNFDRHGEGTSLEPYQAHAIARVRAFFTIPDPEDRQRRRKKKKKKKKSKRGRR